MQMPTAGGCSAGTPVTVLMLLQWQLSSSTTSLQNIAICPTLLRRLIAATTAAKKPLGGAPPTSASSDQPVISIPADAVGNPHGTESSVSRPLGETMLSLPAPRGDIRGDGGIGSKSFHTAAITSSFAVASCVAAPRVSTGCCPTRHPRPGSRMPRRAPAESTSRVETEATTAAAAAPPLPAPTARKIAPPQVPVQTRQEPSPETVGMAACQAQQAVDFTPT
mmetsp:Transcript_16770/g.46872  ORF Transcript_16770/g.46872 Transcript_16770/m.46872 type:complete len:222 (+) Transcript_16770:1613-2278(+)